MMQTTVGRKFFHYLLVSVSWIPIAANAAQSAAAAPPHTTARRETPKGKPEKSLGVEEINVTASRRQTSVKNTPMSVTSFSAKTLSQNNVRSLQDLKKLDPSLNIQSFGATESQIIIRGMSSSVGSTTSVYLDETPLLGGFNSGVHRGDGTPGLRMYDLQRAEVLKGPQGTLFGASSMDGTVRTITNKPDLEKYSGHIDARAAGMSHGNPYFDGDLVANVPVVKNRFALRFVGWGEEGGGYITQYVNGKKYKNINDEHLKGGRILAKLRVTDRFFINASLNYQQTMVDGAQNFTQSLGAYKYAQPTKEPYFDEYAMYSIGANYKADFGDFMLNYSHGNRRTTIPEDTTPTSLLYGLGQNASFVPRTNYHDSTVEGRFVSSFHAPVQLIAGGYYQQDVAAYQATTMAIDGTGDIPCYTVAECAAAGLRKPGPNFGNSGNSVNDNILFANTTNLAIRQYAFYGRLDYKPIKALDLTAGVRYLDADLHETAMALQDISDWAAGSLTSPYSVLNKRTKQSKTTFDFSALYSITPDISLYFRAASGFRLGGINTTSYAAAQLGDKSVPISYAPDSVWDYEGGIKGYALDRRLSYALSYYHMNWSNMQLTAESSGAYTYILNAGRTNINGVEANVSLVPTRGLTLSGGLTYVDARLAQDLPEAVASAGNPGKKGDRVPLVPHWSASAQARYERPLGDGYTGFVQTSFTYRDSSRTTFNQSDNYTFNMPSYFMMDFSMGMLWKKYSLSFFAENITNKVAYYGSYISQDGNRIYSSRPAMMGAKFSADF